MNLNVGIGFRSNIAYPPSLDIDVQADIDHLEGVNVVCDLAHLPFRNDSFEKVYCFHVLEHLANPVEGLKELIRVCSGVVELEVPHRLSKWAKSHGRVGAKSHGHVTSFRCMWFYRCLKQFSFCLKTPWDFPRLINIHVWIFPHLKRSTYDQRRNQNEWP